jgi:hypothetical protein
LKVTMMEVPNAELFHATVDGKPVREVDSFCSDPDSAPLRIQLPHARRRRPGRSRFAPLHGQARISADGHRGGVKLLAASGAGALAVLLIMPAPGGRVVQLPGRRTVEMHREMLVDERHGIARIAAAGTVLRAAPISMAARSGGGRRGRHSAEFTLDGNRDKLERRTGLPPSDKPFSQFTRGNGVLAAGPRGCSSRTCASAISPDSRCWRAGRGTSRIERVDVADSGSRDAGGRNNSTGGILLEEGTRDFRVSHSQFRNIRGNGVWTHSLFTSPRNADGLIAFQ